MKYLNGIDMTGNKILNVGTPTTATDAANKSYVDSVASSVVARVKSTNAATTTSSTTPVDITGLAFSLTSGTMYHFRFQGVYQTAATTTGIGFTFTGPATTYCAWFVSIQQGNAGTAQYYSNSTTSITAQLTSASVINSGTNYLWRVEGLIQPSATSTLQLRTVSEVGGSSITVQAGSLGILTVIG
jgi:hypothetical protein